MKGPIRLAAGVALLLNAAWTTPVARAEGGSSSFTENANWPQPRFEAKVESRPDGVDVRISARETIPGQGTAPQPATKPSQAPAAAPPAAPAAQPAADSGVRSWSDDGGYHRVTADGHTQDLTAPNIGLASQDSWNAAYQGHINEQPYLLFVDNQFQGVVWIPDQPNVNRRFGGPPEAPPDTPGAGCGGCTDARQVALDIETHIPLPPIKIQINPQTGLVGMAGWFWVDGYDGRPIQQSRTVTVPPPAPGLPPTSFTVTVRVWPDEYKWEFGDGGALTTQSLGKAYPTESDIKHIYEHSSLPFDTGFPIFLTVRFRAEFSVNGGTPQPLPPIQHTYRTDHPVQEIQAILSHR
jgi:hypothetical protein